MKNTIILILYLIALTIFSCDKCEKPLEINFINNTSSKIYVRWANFDSVYFQCESGFAGTTLNPNSAYTYQDLGNDECLDDDELNSPYFSFVFVDSLYCTSETDSVCCSSQPEVGRVVGRYTFTIDSLDARNWEVKVIE